ncbi:MAG: signal peptidase I [Gammaproteobacteria bacterium]|nr:MAG: signal peptidase I [Gammaproteobacteria bacterium]
MDFALIMFIALVVTGVIWLIDRFIIAPKRLNKAAALKQAGGSEEAVAKMGREPLLVEYARAFFPVILIVFILRSFLVEPFRIPSGSMLPSLLPGDFILVNKFNYGIRLPVANIKVIDVNQPQRGEVMVFRYPGDPSINYIKRVVGLPGDRIVYLNKRLYINGQPMTQTENGLYDSKDGLGGVSTFTRRVEDLGGLRHDILVSQQSVFPGAPATGPALEFTVPEGRYFVMGDNRDRSNDSRFWGYVPDENLVGKAFFIWFSWDLMANDKGFFEKILWNRLGKSIN